MGPKILKPDSCFTVWAAVVAVCTLKRVGRLGFLLGCLDAARALLLLWCSSRPYLGGANDATKAARELSRAAFNHGEYLQYR